ncbi:MAG: hypothetical protein HY747_06100 [Elusimicrobia bacterium]|nr:hypothetical protein [Elusimicrobiota bacterium]
MIVGLGIIILGFLILIDNRIVFLTDKERPCVMIRICRQCIKKSDAACGLERLFLFATLSLAILNLMPLISPLMPLQREVIIFGSRVCQWSPEILQILEFRIYPLVGFILFIASFFILLAIKETPARYARYTFSLGMGFLFFPLFQYILLHCYYDRMDWSAFWEELTELMLASGILIFLWVFPGLAKKQNEEKLC